MVHDGPVVLTRWLVSVVGGCCRVWTRRAPGLALPSPPDRQREPLLARPAARPLTLLIGPTPGGVTGGAVTKESRPGGCRLTRRDRPGHR